MCLFILLFLLLFSYILHMFYLYVLYTTLSYRKMLSLKVFETICVLIDTEKYICIRSFITYLEHYNKINLKLYGFQIRNQLRVKGRLVGQEPIRVSHVCICYLNVLISSEWHSESVHVYSHFQCTALHIIEHKLRIHKIQAVLTVKAPSTLHSSTKQTAWHWWHTPVITAFRLPRQEDSEFKANLAKQYDFFKKLQIDHIKALSLISLLNSALLSLNYRFDAENQNSFHIIKVPSGR